MTGKRYSVEEALERAQRGLSKNMATRLMKGMTTRDYREFRSRLKTQFSKLKDSLTCSAPSAARSSGRAMKKVDGSGTVIRVPLKDVLDIFPAFKMSETMSVMASVIENNGGVRCLDLRKWYVKGLDDGSVEVRPGGSGLRIPLSKAGSLLHAADSLHRKWRGRSQKPAPVGGSSKSGRSS